MLQDLRIGLRTFGLVALERPGPPFDPSQITEAEQVLEELGLRRAVRSHDLLGMR